MYVSSENSRNKGNFHHNGPDLEASRDLGLRKTVIDVMTHRKRCDSIGDDIPICLSLQNSPGIQNKVGAPPKRIEANIWI